MHYFDFMCFTFMCTSQYNSWITINMYIMLRIQKAIKITWIRAFTKIVVEKFWSNELYPRYSRIYEFRKQCHKQILYALEFGNNARTGYNVYGWVHVADEWLRIIIRAKKWNDWTMDQMNKVSFGGKFGFRKVECAIFRLK